MVIFSLLLKGHKQTAQFTRHHAVTEWLGTVRSVPLMLQTFSSEETQWTELVIKAHMLSACH